MLHLIHRDMYWKYLDMTWQNIHYIQAQKLSLGWYPFNRHTFVHNGT